MPLAIGQIIRGLNSTYRLSVPLKGASVFKAEILRGPNVERKWAVIKCATNTDEEKCLTREYNNYSKPAISQSKHVRTLLDTITEGLSNKGKLRYLVFEWMDFDLRSLPAERFQSGSPLLKLISTSTLSFLEILERLKLVHTDINPNNLFISGIESDIPTVKIGDLGNLVPEGYRTTRVQSLVCRAPEVWRGLGCFPSSDIWSLGVTLAHLTTRDPIFGIKDKKIDDHSEAWCIAKLQRLLGPLGEPARDRVDYCDEFELAKQFQEWNDLWDNTTSLREKLEKFSGPSPLLEFILFLLIVDPKRRPTASEALQHPYLRTIH